MEKNTKQYVEYLQPGLVLSRTSHKEVDHNDPMKVEIGEHTVAFRFFDEEYVVDGKKQREGDRNYTSKWFFIGKRLTLDEVIEHYGNIPEYETLINNMKRMDINSVCMTRFGNFMAMEDGSITLEEYILEHTEEKQAIKSLKSINMDR